LIRFNLPQVHGRVEAVANTGRPLGGVSTIGLFEGEWERNERKIDYTKIH